MFKRTNWGTSTDGSYRGTPAALWPRFLLCCFQPRTRKRRHPPGENTESPELRWSGWFLSCRVAGFHPLVSTKWKARGCGGRHTTGSGRRPCLSSGGMIDSWAGATPVTLTFLRRSTPVSPMIPWRRWGCRGTEPRSWARIRPSPLLW